MAATVRYLAFAALAVAGPGLAAQRLLRLAVDRALVLPLGLALCSGAFWLSAVSGVPWLGALLLLALDGTLLLRRRDWSVAAGPSLRGAVPPLLAIAGLLAVTQYPGNRVARSGEFLLDPFLAADTAFHVGVTRELATGYPPQVPGLAGHPLGYHLGTDLVRAAALRWARADPFDSIGRFDVTLFALALLLAVRAMAWTAGLRGTAVALAGWSLLATDVSFVFAANAQAHWWSDLLRGNLLVSLFLANPVVPALALALGALVALARALEDEGRGWALVAAALAVAVAFFKVFLGAHLLLALALACVFHRSAPRPALGMAVAASAATLVLATGTGAQTVTVALDPFDLARVTRDTLGLEPATGLRLAAWVALWTLASLGLRVLGLWEAASALRSRLSLASSTLALLALTGWPLGLMLRVSAVEVLGGQRFVNDAAYLLEQSAVPLWIFTAAALVRLFAHGALLRVTSAVAATVLCAPATAQFVIKKARLAPDPIPAAYVRAMRAVEENSRPGDVVLQRPVARFPPLPVILAGRRVVYERFTPYSTQFASAAELTRRHERVFRFFRTADAAEAAQIARELDAVLVVLYGPDRLRFDDGRLLTPVYEEPQARVFRVARTPLYAPGPGGRE